MGHGEVPGLLRALRGLTPVDMAFSATVDARGDSFVLDRFDGAVSGSLHGVRSAVDDGLGGRCIALRHPVYVADYVTARGISHRYDGPVSAEGLRSIVAVPVIEQGRVHTVVYAGTRRPRGFGERLVDRAVSLVRSRTAVPSFPPGRPGPDPDALCELRDIARAITEPGLRRRMDDVLARLGADADRAGAPPVSLTPREREVLAEVATGRGNRDVAVHMGLTEQTVKSYLKAAMSKLDSHTRGEAVHRARRAGLLP